MALKGTENEPSPTESDTQFSKKYTSEDKGIAVIHNSLAHGVEVEPEDFSSEHNERMKGSKNENKCRVGSSIVRRLFMDKTVSEIEEPNSCTNNAGLPQVPVCDDDVAGLSYVDSQEPGELSQDNALEFVDRFLRCNVMDFDQEGDIGRSIGGKSKSVSSTKGAQSLAKRNSCMSTAEERGTFDWDDSHEDEEGGEFFSKKKEVFFDDGSGRRKRSTKRQKLKNYSKGRGAVDETIDKGILLQNSKRNEKRVNIIQAKSVRSATKELDEQLKIAAPDGIEATGTDMGMPEMLNAEFDTQMASESMEALCFDLDVANCDNKDTTTGTKNVNEGSSRGEKGNRAWSKTCVRRKRSSLVNECHFQGQAATFTPIACRTRQRSVTNPLRVGIATYDSGKASILNAKQSGELESVTEQERSHQKLSDTIASFTIGEFRGTHIKLNGSSTLCGSVNQNVEQEMNEQSTGKSNRSENNALKRKKRASTYDGPLLSAVDKGVSGIDAFKCSSIDDNVVRKDTVGALASKPSDRQSDADTISAGGNSKLEVSPVDKCKPSASVSSTPINRTTPISAASPICVGDEYLKQSCRKNLSRSFHVREISSLISNSPDATFMTRDSKRRRREMANVRVLLSHHLNEDIIKRQKKILARLGASVASFISEATHFIADKFVRTRNVLEAIASGKPVVTHLWLESCGQASCFIDERNFILRDTKKEKEFGFSLPVSLAHACQHPLLQGQKVLITQNTKPGKELLTSLVKAVHGQAVERIDRSAFKGGKLPDDLLVISCEEDYGICAPLLEKGAAVYSSELLLNGVVTQKLVYQRHRLFVDCVKKTSSRYG